MSIPSENEMPRFIKDMCEPLFDIMTTTDLALESFLWNICINTPVEGAPENNSLKLFMEVAHQVWRIAPLDMPNTQGVNA